MIRQAVIIAGGKGTRLKSILGRKPKILVNLEQDTLLDYQINYLRNNKIEKIHFCLGYKSQYILDYLNNKNINYTYSIEDKPLGTYGALLNSKEYLDEKFFVLYGDVLTNLDIQKEFKLFLKYKSDAHLILRYTNHPEDSDLVALRENQVISISRLSEVNNSIMPIGNTSLLFLQKKLLKEQYSQKKIDLFQDFIKKNIKNLYITGSISLDYIRDIGTKDRYETEIPKYKDKINKPYSVAFFDRDGTLIADQGNENNPEKLKFNNLSLEIMSYLQSINFKTLLVTNQPGLAKGFFKVQDLIEFNSKMLLEIIAKKINPFDDIFICPHHPESGFVGEVNKLKISCTCRKPETGLVDEAISKHNLDKKKFIFIGDTERDYILSKKFNSPFYLIKSIHTNEEYFEKLNIYPLRNIDDFKNQFEKNT